MNNLTFRTARPEEFDPAFRKFNDDWMLISASDGSRKNLMTASWGCLGILWNKPVAVCFVRPQRFTFDIIEHSDRLALSFLPDDYRSALRYCGKFSGRDVGDKFAGAGLTPAFSPDGIPYPAEADRVLLCRKLYVDDLKKNGFLDPSLLKNYPSDDFHRVYICGIESFLVKNM